MGRVATTETTATVRPTNVDELRDRANHLLPAHWREAAWRERADAQPPPLCPDWRAFYALEERGVLLARIWEMGNEVVGYTVSVLLPHPYFGCLTCFNELVYLSRSARKGLLGLRMLRDVESVARGRGAEMVVGSAPPGNGLHLLLPRLGYRELETRYVKRLGGV